MDELVVIGDAPRAVIAPHAEETDKKRSNPNTQRIVKAQLNHRNVEPATGKCNGTIGLMVINKRGLDI